VLAAFVRDDEIDAQHGAVLVVAQAGWRIANDLVIPTGLELALLPAEAPERQPAERHWALLDELVADRTFADLDALEAMLIDRGRTLDADRVRLRAHPRYHWWPPKPSSGILK